MQRHAGRPDFVQVSLLTRTVEPMGQRRYWPIGRKPCDRSGSARFPDGLQRSAISKAPHHMRSRHPISVKLPTRLVCKHSRSDDPRSKRAGNAGGVCLTESWHFTERRCVSDLSRLMVGPHCGPPRNQRRCRDAWGARDGHRKSLNGADDRCATHIRCRPSGVQQAEPKRELAAASHRREKIRLQQSLLTSAIIVNMPA